MDRFDASVTAVATLLADARDDWWVIGSAAARLHSAGGPPGRDIDILVSLRDGLRLSDRLVTVASNLDSATRFRSALFGGWPGAPLPVEIMADLSVRTGAVWKPVRLRTRESVSVAGMTLWVPARGELIALFRRFGRPKDHARAAALAAMR